MRATFEGAVAEAPNFDYYGGWIYGNPTASHTGTYCSDIQGVTGSQISLAKSYHVYAGDKFELNGWAMLGNKCCSYSGDLPTFATALLTAFHLSAPALGETHTASAAISQIGTMAAAGDGYGSTDETDIRGFFTILVYDKNYNLVDTKYQQISSDGYYENIDLQYTAVGEGYIYAYISQEDVSITNLYIDDVTMIYTPSRIVQSTEYYPFGMQTAASWTRKGTSNKYLYDGGSELNETSGFYDLPYRNYDASLGRFFQIDPMAYKTSDITPYNYAGNNPILFNDPTGLEYASAEFLYGDDESIPTDWADDGGGGGGEVASSTTDTSKSDDATTTESDFTIQVNGESVTVHANQDGTYSAIVGDQAYIITVAPGTAGTEAPVFEATAVGTGPTTEVTSNRVSDSQSTNLDLASAAAQGVLGAFETGSATGTLQSVGKATFSTVKAGLKFTKALGSAGAVVSILNVGYNVANTGNITGSDITNLATTAALLTAGVVLGTAAAPALAVAGLIVGIASFIGQDYLNETIGTYKIF